MASPSHLVSIQNQKGRTVSAELAADVIGVAIPAGGIAATTFYTTPGHGISNYLAIVHIAVTTAGAAGNFDLSLSWTDPTINAEKIMAFGTGTGPSTAATGVRGFTAAIRAKAATAIKYTIAAGGAASAGELTIILLRLK